MDALQTKLRQRMGNATSVVQQDVIGSISRSGPRPAGGPPGTRSGRLRESIDSSVSSSPSAVTGTVSAGAWYARNVELGFFGRGKDGQVISVAPRPFLEPALQRNLQKVLSILKE
ncbi:MAG: hypothetical protein AAGG47_08000 [Pseudomonadota bacterium]